MIVVLFEFLNVTVKISEVMARVMTCEHLTLTILRKTHVMLLIDCGIWHARTPD